MPIIADAIVRVDNESETVIIGEAVVQGMYRSVTTVNRRDQINAGSRARGMIVRVTNDINAENNGEWELSSNDLTNAGWTRKPTAETLLGDPSNVIAALKGDGLL